jgi:hypothetical protein
MLQLHDGAQRHVFEVRYVRKHEWVQLIIWEDSQEDGQYDP